MDFSYYQIVITVRLLTFAISTSKIISRVISNQLHYISIYIDNVMKLNSKLSLHSVDILYQNSTKLTSSLPQR